MIADERAKRLAGIDAAADEVEAAVVAEERALAERQKAAEELERQANGEAPVAPTTPDEADAEPLPMPPQQDRKSVVSGKSVSVRVSIGGRRIINKKNTQEEKEHSHQNQTQQPKHN